MLKTVQRRLRILERKTAALYALYLSLEDLGELGFSDAVRKSRLARLRRRREKASSIYAAHFMLCCTERACRSPKVVCRASPVAAASKQICLRSCAVTIDDN